MAFFQSLTTPINANTSQVKVTVFYTFINTFNSFLESFSLLARQCFIVRLIVKFLNTSHEMNAANCISGQQIFAIEIYTVHKCVDLNFGLNRD